jgi:hypothetical protein
MNAPKFVVIKVSRPDPITDKPVNFPPLKNLHLELLEIKKKLKKNIPAITVRKPEPKQAEPDESSSSEENEPQSDGEDDAMAEFKPKTAAESSNAPNAQKEPAPSREPSGDEDVNDEDDDGASNAQLSVVDEAPQLSPEEKEKLDQEEREELIVKFRTLKKAYPQNKELQLISVGEYDDLDAMRKMYKRTLTEITFDKKISNYRYYLTISFMVVEYAFKHLGVNMDGFAKHQTKCMDDYNSLLVELGEKTQGSWMDNFPVEVRLMGLVLFQTAVFWFAKNKNIDISNIMNILSGMVPKEQPQVAESPAAAEEVPAKKMRGPSIKPRS